MWSNRCDRCGAFSLSVFQDGRALCEVCMDDLDEQDRLHKVQVTRWTVGLLAAGFFVAGVFVEGCR